MVWEWQPDLPLLEEMTIGMDCLLSLNRVELASWPRTPKWWIDIPCLTSICCHSVFLFLTELVSENADALAIVLRSKSPWCNYEPALPFTVLNDQSGVIECLRIASRTGNSVELEEVDLSSLTNLHSLHIEERCFLFTKRLIVHDLPLLQSIHIERFCFIVSCQLVDGSLLSIKNCSQLESIHIGNGCFCSYSSMELEREWQWKDWWNRPRFSCIVLCWWW